jgi:hypothetical protein
MAVMGGTGDGAAVGALLGALEGFDVAVLLRTRDCERGALARSKTSFTVSLATKLPVAKVLTLRTFVKVYGLVS